MRPPSGCSPTLAARTARRAEQALEQGKALGQQEAEALRTTLLLLHDDHRRMVDLRWEVDRAVARTGPGGPLRRIRLGHGTQALALAEQFPSDAGPRPWAEPRVLIS
jgi:hypothetical protein